MSCEQLDLFPNEESLPQGGPARATQWQGVVAAWLTHARDCGGTSCGSWLAHAPVGSSARTSLACYRSTTEMTTASSFTTWAPSDTAGRVECWTLSSSEYPNDAVVSSLSDILVTSGDLSKYWLTPKAAAGIVRRAERRGRELPQLLRAALAVLASRHPGDDKKTT